MRHATFSRRNMMRQARRASAAERLKRCAAVLVVLSAINLLCWRQTQELCMDVSVLECRPPALFNSLL